LVHLKEKGVVHRDIKPKNIMVNENGLIEIIDFGVSKILYSNSSDIVGTPPYISPEII
jgi:serine/threonine-protein kinase